MLSGFLIKGNNHENNYVEFRRTLGFQPQRERNVVELQRQPDCKYAG